MSRAPVKQQQPGLSRRMRQVLELAGRGLTNKQIAADLGIAEKTAEEYRGRIMQRLGAKNMTQAAVTFERMRTAEK